ncbi:MAG: VPDSG-CTERM sorting domain-containing protein [Opitutaceae bacterium]|nr:VPDSG-CTERM sorting domain-containing protein [Opitutaceae bacterium]
MNSLCSLLLRLRFAGALLALCGSAHAAIIQPNTAVASSDAGFPGPAFAAVNTINGSGLAGPVGTLPTHAQYDVGNHWTSDGIGNFLESITWGFTTPQTLDTIYLWNHQSNNIAANPGYDVGNFDLKFFDSSNAQIGAFSGTLAFDSNAAQAFAFGAIAGVSSVRFDVKSTQSSITLTGLAEVAFNTATISPNNTPDGASTAGLLGLSLLALVCFSRRLSPA